MKSALSLASLFALSEAYLIKNDPLINFGLLKENIASAQNTFLQAGQSVFTLPYSYSETVSLYTYNGTSQALESTDNMKRTTQTDANRNK